jgi:uncharacterized protein
MAPHQYLTGILAGILVGLTLGLVGGGGSILAVPLMVYAVGVTDPHAAVGTSALAVALNAAFNAAAHARNGTVRWKPAGTFAIAGVIGAWLGSVSGKALAAERLLFCFAMLVLIVGISMLRGGIDTRPTCATTARPYDSARVGVIGFLVGALSGFFGIGGGFLIVPGLMYAAHLPILAAIGSSLVAVTAFSLTTALNYARSGWVIWPLAAIFAIGGAAGGVAGAALARRLSLQRGALNMVFGVLLFIVAFYMLYRSAHVFVPL